MSLLFNIYGKLWRCAAPWLRRQKRFNAGFASREVPPGWPWDEQIFPERSLPEMPALGTATSHSPQQRPPGRVIWIQAASAGEAWLVHPLVKSLEAQLQEGTQQSITLLCTSFTPQGLEILQKIHTESEYLKIVTAFFPIDHPAIMEKALQQVSPDSVVLLETELWPGLLYTAKKHKTPVLVCNARMTEKSLRSYSICKKFWQSIAPTQVLATTSEDAARFSELFAIKAITMPNIKFDRAFHSLHADGIPEADLRKKMLLPPPSPANIILALASVREEEENLLIECLEHLKPYKNISVVIAPRHQTRIPFWQKSIENLGIQPQLRSQILGPEYPAANNVSATAFHKKAKEAEPLKTIIWDTFGDLRELYLMADIAFVGGSLMPLGGQNFLEALEAGLVPHTGAHLKNFLWASKDLQKLGLLQVHENADKLTKNLIREIETKSKNPDNTWEITRQESKKQICHQFACWLEQQTGGSAQCAKAILQSIDKQSF